MITRRTFLQSSAAAAFAAGAGSARADDAPGVTGTEIKIGQTMPYSGPASAYGVIGRTEVAYFKMINEQGGVNGRKINLLSLDDGYSPPKTVEQVRRLVEEEKVAFLFQTLGTPPNLAIRQYLNDNKVPQLFVATGAAAFSDPEHFPWTMGYNPNYRTEAHIYAKAILKTKPDGKIAVLYQNDGFGKDYLIGLKDVLGSDHAGMLVKEASYETSEPTVDSQIVTLQGSGADILIIADHASNRVPPGIGLDIEPRHLNAHVAIDIGYASFTLRRSPDDFEGHFVVCIDSPGSFCDRISVRPGRPVIPISTGIVTMRSTSSGDRPGTSVATCT